MLNTQKSGACLPTRNSAKSPKTSTGRKFTTPSNLACGSRRHPRHRNPNLPSNNVLSRHSNQVTHNSQYRHRHLTPRLSRCLKLLHDQALEQSTILLSIKKASLNTCKVAIYGLKRNLLERCRSGRTGRSRKPLRALPSASSNLALSAFYKFTKVRRGAEGPLKQRAFSIFDNMPPPMNLFGLTTNFVVILCGNFYDLK